MRGRRSKSKYRYRVETETSSYVRTYVLDPLEIARNSGDSNRSRDRLSGSTYPVERASRKMTKRDVTPCHTFY
eukprot:1380163-Amorphochlora_amoeboformis.AAC.1